METQKINKEDLGSSTMPEGMVIVGEKFICTEHGDVTHGCLILPYFIRDDDGVKKYNFRVCVQCLKKVIENLTEQGKVGELIQQHIVATPEEAEKLKAEKEQKIKELSEKAKEEQLNAESSVN